MKFGCSILAALRAVYVNKLRSGLTMLGVVLGVSSVIVMMAVGTGARVRIENDMRTLGSNIIVLNSGALKTAGVSKGVGTKPSVTLADAEAIRDIPMVFAAASQNNSSSIQMVYGNANWAGPVVGTTPEYFSIREWTIVGGRAFNQDDLDQGGKVAVLGRTVADKLFGNQSPVGQEIRINRVPVTVIGELGRKGQSLS